jgi:hypothetical protein
MSTYHNFSTVERIAEANHVYASARSEQGRSMIELSGRTRDLEKVIEQVQGYIERWADENRSPRPRDPEKEAVVYLYSGRTNWAKLGY